MLLRKRLWLICFVPIYIIYLLSKNNRAIAALSARFQLPNSMPLSVMASAATTPSDPPRVDDAPPGPAGAARTWPRPRLNICSVVPGLRRGRAGGRQGCSEIIPPWRRDARQRPARIGPARLEADNGFLSHGFECQSL